MSPHLARLAVPAAAVAVALVLAPAAAQPPAIPADSPLKFVPHDAAIFVHADAAAVFGGPLWEAAKKAQPDAVTGLLGQAKDLFGLTPEQLKTVTAFWPKLQGPDDMGRVGLVLGFKAAFDQDALKAGVEKASEESPVPIRVVVKDATTAVLLFGGLNAGAARPRPAAEAGPLTPFLREAAAGKHLLAAGINFDHLPPEIRGNQVPPSFEPFRPIFQADAVAAFLDLGKELSLDLRVKASTPVKAGEAEKSLAALVAISREAIKGIPAEQLTAPATKNLMGMLKALDGGLGKAKYKTEGTETRVTVTIPADQPFGAVAAEAIAAMKGAGGAPNSSFNNLRQIALAMHNYEAQNGSFPPAAVVDKAGRPLLSWRVLILPFLDHGDLYRQFKLDEPWDGPNNKKLLEKMPRVYDIPAKTEAGATTETHYQVFVGKGAAFEQLKGARIADFTDGTSNTILVATAAKAVPWTKPEDIAFDPTADMTKALGFFPTTAAVAMADGSVRTLARTVPRATLGAMITRAAGDTFDLP